MPEHKERRRHKKEVSKCKSSSSGSSSSSSSDSECEDFDEVYCYYKRHLLKDPSLMIAGSSVYTNLYNQDTQEIPVNAPVRFDIAAANLNTDHPTNAGSVFVRESGTYLVTYAIETNEPSQFAIFVNNIVQPQTVVGINTGSGQLVGRTVLPLLIDDGVIVRNHVSSVAGASVHVPQFAGGSAIQANVQLVMYKIAPHPCDWCIPRSKVDHHKNKDLYKKLEAKMLCDHELQLEGFDAYGKFFTQTSQTVAVESSVTFDQHSEVRCLSHVIGSSDVTIEKSGLYHLFGLVATTQVAQFGIFVNGSVLPQSVVGTNKGAGQLSSRVLSELKKGDIVSWRNHTSATSVTLAMNPGGTIPAISGELEIVRIAPLCSPKKEKRDPCHPVERYCEPSKVRDFKDWLLCQKKPQIQGSEAIIALRVTTPQTINLGEPITWKIKTIDRNVGYIQGEDKIYVCESGEYDILVDVTSNQADQFTLFVNGKPINTTTTGQDSGSSRCLIRTIQPLCKGDYVTLVNWKSSVNPVVTSLNPGGTEVGLNASFIMYRLGPQLCVDSPKRCK